MTSNSNIKKYLQSILDERYMTCDYCGGKLIIFDYICYTDCCNQINYDITVDCDDCGDERRYFTLLTTNKEKTDDK